MTTTVAINPIERATRIRAIDDYRIRDSDSERWIMLADSVLLIDRVSTDPQDRSYSRANIAVFSPHVDVIYGLSSHDLRVMSAVLTDYANLLETA